MTDTPEDQAEVAAEEAGAIGRPDPTCGEAAEVALGDDER